MRTLKLILFFSLFFLLHTHSHAQTDEKFFVASESLENIEGPWIEMQFVRWKQAKYMFIFYGQDCIPSLDALGHINSKKIHRECVLLKDGKGDMVMFNHHLEGINFLDQKGFDLVEIIPHPELRSLIDASYIFKRRPETLEKEN